MATYSVFGQVSPGLATVNDSSTYTLGMQFSLSQGAALTGIWFFSGTGATALPTACCIYQVTGTGTGTQVTGTVNTSPSWSGAAASGWVKASYNGSVTLTANTNYKVCILKDGTTFVYVDANHYWDTGNGSGGITNSIISAPNSAGGDGGQDTFIAGVSVLTYPTSVFQASNYYLDVEVSYTPVFFSRRSPVSIIPLLTRRRQSFVPVVPPVTAALSAPSVLTASPSVTQELGSLWAAYLAAADTFAQLSETWRMIAPVSRTDGTSGFQYAKVYTAEKAMDDAYAAWAALRRQLNPAPPSN